MNIEIRKSGAAKYSSFIYGNVARCAQLERGSAEAGSVKFELPKSERGFNAACDESIIIVDGIPLLLLADCKISMFRRKRGDVRRGVG